MYVCLCMCFRVLNVCQTFVSLCDVKVIGLIFSPSHWNKGSKFHVGYDFWGWRAFMAHFHVTALRNSYEINEIKVIFSRSLHFVSLFFFLALSLFRTLSLFDVSFFSFTFLLYKLSYYIIKHLIVYLSLDCLASIFFTFLCTFYVDFHSSFHSLILHTPKV